MYLCVDTESKGGGSFGKLTHVYCISWARTNQDGVVQSGSTGLWYDMSKPMNEEQAVALEKLQIAADTHTLVFHNAAHDLDVLHQLNIEVPNWEDTMLQSYCAYPSREEQRVPGVGLSRHSLGAWGVVFEDEKLSFTKDWDKEHQILMSMCEEDDWTDEQFAKEESMLEYAAKDAEITERLRVQMTKEMSDSAKQIYESIDKPYVAIIRTMTEHGMFVNTNRLLELQVEWGNLLETARQTAVYMAGKTPTGTKKLVKPKDDDEDLVFVGMEQDPKKPERELYVYKVMGEFNPNSGDQVAWALSSMYGWVPEKFTPTKKPDTSAEVLGALDYPLVTPLLDVAEYSKLVGTYAEPLCAVGSANGGWVRPSWNQSIAITGRLSCSTPNLQNIPTRTERGQELRKAFVAPPGYKMCGVDLQAIEYRVLAALMAEHFFNLNGVVPDDVQFMVDTFNSNEDIHTAMAQLWMGGRPDYVGKEKKYRSIGKNISYGNMFGFGADKAAVMIGCSKKEAQALMDMANETNPSMPEYKRAVWDDYKAHGGVSHSLYGREFRYPDLMLPERGKNKWLLYRAQRQAFNAKIQGTAADILKLLQLWKYNNVLPKYPGSFQIASVHDESLYLVPERYADDFCSDVTAHYKNNSTYMPFVFIDGDCNQGDSWYSLK